MKEIKLTQGKTASVDDSDFETLSLHKWLAYKDWRTSTWYAARREKGKTILMHRVILGLTFKDGREGDHKDGDGLNNQRRNLRRCSRLQNGRNLKVQTRAKYSKFKGVSLKPYLAKPWLASVTVSGVLHHLGYFYTEESAALAYNLAASRNFGEFARLNVLP